MNQSFEENREELFTIKANGVDVTEIMQKVREKIAKGKFNLMSHEDLDELTGLNFVFPSSPSEIGDELIDNFESPEKPWNLNISEIYNHFYEEGQDWNLNPGYKIISHRKLSGQIIIIFKKLISPFIRLYTDYLVYRQAKINHDFFKASENIVRDQGRINQYLGFINHNLIKELTKTKLQLDSLECTITQMKSQIELLEKREKSLEDMIDTDLK
jgi:hypothetical protein